MAGQFACMRILAVLCLLSSWCSASTLSDVLCTIGEGTVSGSGACDISDSFGSVAAAASTSELILGSTVTIQTQATVAVVTNATPDGFRAATASIVDDDALVSSGSPRPGYLQLTVNNVDNLSGASWATIADASAPYSYTFPSCYGGCSNTMTVPFELGENLNVTVGSIVADEAGFADPVNDMQIAAAKITFELFEADGVTPDAIDYTPEPATSGLAVAGCLLLFATLARLAMRRR
ncbi:MAG: hypothetical protein JO061_18385 [Acidobacteriaceae bacterium]|nr:hypothetical protein [Acidobacteriaceae bacterium]